MLKSSGFQTLTNFKMSSKCDRDVSVFFLMKADTQANPWIFSDSEALTIINKNS